MSINIKKYTKDQLAKMVDEAAERLKSQKKENEELAEKLKSQTAKTIAMQNDGRRAFLRLWAGLGRFYAPRQKAPLPRVTVYAESAGNRTKIPAGKRGIFL